jgi:hypothetical protein
MKRFTRHLTMLTAIVLIAGCDMAKPAKKSTTTPPAVTANPATTTNYQSGAGAVQNVRAAVQRTVTTNDLAQIRIFIENASLASGSMPSVNDTYDALKKEAPKIAQLIDEKVLTLNPAKTREQVWAYETAAYTNGGLVLTSSGVERMDASVLKQKLQQ